MNVRKLFNAMLSLGTATSVFGCDRPASQAAPMASIEQTIKNNANAPIDQSLKLVGAALKQQAILVATDGTAATQQSSGSLNRLRFKSALDNQGRMWAYAYTNKNLFEKTFPPSSEFAEISFRDFFGIIDSNQQFAGIYLNAGSDSSYPIPRQVFSILNETLR